MKSKSTNLISKYLGSKIIQISETEKKQCNFFSVRSKKKITPSINHHILLVDVSGSMYNEIDQLKIKLINTLDALKSKKNNYVSVIIYSGHQQCFRIINAVKCDRTSYKMAQVYEILEKELYTRSVTVISEPLEKSLEIIKDLADVCDKHHIALFTDGCLVPTRWNSKIEEEKCYEVAKICNEQGIFLNTIGFGAYYDRNFLKNLVSLANTGSFIHIDEIKDYYKTILNLTSFVDKKEMVSIDINNNDYFIINESRRFNEPSTIKTLKSTEENIIVVFEDWLEIEGKISSNALKEVNEEISLDFLYSLALYHILNEDIDSAEIALAQSKDIMAYESLSNCYSFVEKGQAINAITSLIENKDKRFKKGKEDIEITLAENEPLCLLEILKEILLDEESKLLWDYGYKYKRIGMKKASIEDEYKFIHPKVGYGDIVDVTIGSKKLNIGVLVKIDGEVQHSLTKLKLDASIYKEYNLIVNGNINTEFLCCKLSKKLKTKLRKEKLIKSTVKTFGEEISILNLKKLKTTNKRLLKSLNQKEIANYLFDIETLSCKQWALKKVIGNLLTENNLNKSDFSNLIAEELEVRKNFNVDNYGFYNGLKTKKIENSSYEIYPAKVLEWKIEKFPKTKTQKTALEYYNSLITDDIEGSYEVLSKELKEIKSEKTKKQHLVNLVRLSAALASKTIFIWDQQEEKAKKEMDKNLNMNMIVGEKVKISRKTIDNISLREDCYEILTKCN